MEMVPGHESLCSILHSSLPDDSPTWTNLHVKCCEGAMHLHDRGAIVRLEGTCTDVHLDIGNGLRMTTRDVATVNDMISAFVATHFLGRGQAARQEREGFDVVDDISVSRLGYFIEPHSDKDGIHICTWKSGLA